METRLDLLKIGALLGGALLAALPMIAAAQEESGTKTARELRASYDKVVKGKTIAFLPIALGIPLQDEWSRVVQSEACGPYFFADLAGVSEVDEQAAIDAGQIQANRIQYVGRRRESRTSRRLTSTIGETSTD